MTPTTSLIPTQNDLVLLPFTLYLLGTVVYLWLTFRARLSGNLTIWRWLGAILLLAGFAISAGPAWDALNPSTGKIYRIMLTQKLFAVHVAVPVIGIGLLLGILLAENLTRKYIRLHFHE